MPCDTVRSTITEPSDTGHLESHKAKILAKKSSDSFARIAVLCSKHRFRGLFRNPRTKNCHFFCEDRQNRYCAQLRVLFAFPFVFDAEVFAVAVVEVGGLGVFGIR